MKVSEGGRDSGPALGLAHQHELIQVKKVQKTASEARPQRNTNGNVVLRQADTWTLAAPSAGDGACRISIVTGESIGPMQTTTGTSLVHAVTIIDMIVGGGRMVGTEEKMIGTDLRETAIRMARMAD